MFLRMTPEQAIAVLDQMFGHGNSLAAAFALLVCGAGMNLGTLVALRNLFGLPSLLRGLAMVLFVVIAVGLLANATVYRPVLDAGEAHAGHEGEGHTHAFDNFSVPVNFSAGTASFSVASQTARDAWPIAGIGAALLVVVMIGIGALVRLSGNRERLRR